MISDKFLYLWMRCDDCEQKYERDILLRLKDGALVCPTCCLKRMEEAERRISNDMNRMENWK